MAVRESCQEECAMAAFVSTFTSEQCAMAASISTSASSPSEGARC
jgi:hypothetical protein